MNCIKRSSPAKLNLFLHITGRRDDGYHNLQTLFQLIDHYDEMSFALLEESEILLEDNTSIPQQQNIITRAASALQQMANSNKGVKIQLKKRIPMGAGLGGGSSNAATTLLALNELWQCHFSITELLSLGTRLGADVPVFVGAQTAFAEGIGEQLYPITLPESWFLVLTPAAHVETISIYKDPQLPRDTAVVDLDVIKDKSSAELLTFSHNDMQNLVRAKYPEVDRALSWLSQFAPARMSGSGSSVFAIVENSQKAEEILAKVPKELTGFVAKGINRVPK